MEQAQSCGARFNSKGEEAAEMAQRIKVPAMEPDDTSKVPGTHMTHGEN